MTCLDHAKRWVAKGVVLMILSLSLSGCANISAYLDFMGRKKQLASEFQQQPRMEVLRELTPENCYSLQGKLTMSRPYEGQILVVAISDRYQRREKVATRILRSPVLYYAVFLPEGEYDLYFFADLNKGGFFETQEMIGRTSPGKPAKVHASSAIDDIQVNGQAVHLDFDHPQTADIPIHEKVTVRGYQYSSLEDDFFDARYGTMGIYRPTEFLTHTQGSIFALEDYDPRKTLVIFVHGVEGTPQDWTFIVEGLDHQRFQPWFYYYPSGLPLEKLGSLLANTIDVMNAATKHSIKRLVIVAHSMGGLVARAAIDRLCRGGSPPYLKMYISMSSPYGGIEDANIGIKSAPVVVPSWRDVATGSPFLKQIYQRDLPPDIPFHMFFGYRNKSGISSDGTITLRSQLDSRVHFKAIKTYGFDTTHVGILNDGDVRDAFNRLLDTIGP